MPARPRAVAEIAAQPGQARTGIADGPDAGDWVLAIALIAVGAILVVVGGLGAPRTTMVVAVLLTSLGVATVWFNIAATVFLVYAAAFVAGAASRRTAHRWFIGLTVLLLLLASASAIPMPFRLAAFAAPILLVWLIGNSVMTDADCAPTLRRIADHVRACTFAVHENVLPGPNREKYVIRRLLRRAVLDGYQMGLRDAFLYQLVPVVAQMMKSPYPELGDTIGSHGAIAVGMQSPAGS